jgi:hypothetical protein
MNKVEAMRALLDGKKIKLTHWSGIKFLYLIGETIYNHRGEKTYMFMDNSFYNLINDNELEEYVPKPTSFDDLKAGDTFESDYNANCFLKYQVVYRDDSNHDKSYIVAQDQYMDPIIIKRYEFHKFMMIRNHCSM